MDGAGVDQWRSARDTISSISATWASGVGDARAALQDASAVALCRERLCHVAPQVPTIRGAYRTPVRSATDVAMPRRRPPSRPPPSLSPAVRSPEAGACAAIASCRSRPQRPAVPRPAALGNLDGGSGGCLSAPATGQLSGDSAGCTVGSARRRGISFDASGVVQISHSDAWWCRDCGRLRVLDCWDRCEPCAAADRAEARRIAQLVAGKLHDSSSRPERSRSRLDASLYLPARRETAPAYPVGSTVACPREVVAIAQHVIGSEICECLIAIFLDARHRVTGYARSPAGRSTRRASLLATFWCQRLEVHRVNCRRMTTRRGR